MHVGRTKCFVQIVCSAALLFSLGSAQSQADDSPKKRLNLHYNFGEPANFRHLNELKKLIASHPTEVVFIEYPGGKCDTPKSISIDSFSVQGDKTGIYRFDRKKLRRSGDFRVRGRTILRPEQYKSCIPAEAKQSFSYVLDRVHTWEGETVAWGFYTETKHCVTYQIYTDCTASCVERYHPGFIRYFFLRSKDVEKLTGKRQCK